MSAHTVWAIVPLKGFTDAKQRLSSVLDARERAELMLAMARDVLAALSAATGVDGIVIASRAQEANALAAEFGADVFRESAGADLSAAVMEACVHLERHKQATTVLVIHGDVPLVAPEDIGRLISVHRDITLVPDSEAEGTNCVLVSPPGRLGFRFGPSSFARHLEAARAAGVEPRIAADPHLGLDVDTPGDLEALLARLTASHTRTYLDRSGIASRMGHPHNSPPTPVRN